MFLMLLKALSLYAMESWKIEGGHGKNYYKLECAFSIKELTDSDKYKIKLIRKFFWDDTRYNGDERETVVDKKYKQEFCQDFLKSTLSFIDDAATNFKSNQLKLDFTQKANSLKERIKDHFQKL